MSVTWGPRETTCLCHWGSHKLGDITQGPERGSQACPDLVIVKDCQDLPTLLLLLLLCVCVCVRCLMLHVHSVSGHHLLPSEQSVVPLRLPTSAQDSDEEEFNRLLHVPAGGAREHEECTS